MYVNINLNRLLSTIFNDIVQLFRTSSPEHFDGACAVVALTGLERLIYPDAYAADGASAVALERDMGVVTSVRAVVVPSEVARRDVIARAGRMPSDVVVVGAPCLRARHTFGPRSAVVVPGAALSHRNAVGAIAAYAALPTTMRDSHRLVLGTGRRGIGRYLARAARAAGISAVLAAPIPACLERAAVALFPAFWDGYSPGAVEALALGVPIAASTSSAAAELATDPELLFDPRDEHALTRALARALATDARRPAPRTARDCGRAVREVWQRVADQPLAGLPNLLPSESDAPLDG